MFRAVVKSALLHIIYALFDNSASALLSLLIQKSAALMYFGRKYHAAICGFT